MHETGARRSGWVHAVAAAQLICLQSAEAHMNHHSGYSLPFALLTCLNVACLITF